MAFWGKPGCTSGWGCSRAPAKFEREETSLKERIALLEKLLHSGDDCADRYDAWYDSPRGRVLLAPGGGLLLGLLLKGTPWADWYARRGAEGHPVYRAAHFYSREEVEALLQQVGFHITAYCSTLFQKLGLERYKEEHSVGGYVPGAGFTGIAA